MSPDPEMSDLARELELDVDDVGICHACLSFVAFPLDLGDEAEVRRSLREFAAVLWADGLALPLQAALHNARDRGVYGAVEAIADVEARGPRAAIVRPVIRRLAADLNARSKKALRRAGFLEHDATVIRLPRPTDSRAEDLTTM